MKKLTQINCLGTTYFRWNATPTRGYLGGDFDTIAEAPLIHTYSTAMETLSSRLVLQKIEPPLMIDTKPFRVSRFLSVQPLTDTFFKDEDGAFRPSVKPHYAINSQNGPGIIYDALCPIALYAKDELIFCDKQPVQIHDSLVSPPTTISGLEARLRNAFSEGKDVYLSSYVVDNINHHLLITEHAMLSETSHIAIFDVLERLPEPSIEDLLALNHPFHKAMTRFETPNWQMDQIHICTLCPTAVVQIDPELLVLPSKTPQNQFDQVMIQLHQDMTKLMANYPEFAIMNHGLDKTILLSLVDAVVDAGKVLIHNPTPNAFKVWFNIHNNIVAIAKEAEINSPFQALISNLNPMFEWVCARIDEAPSVVLKYNLNRTFFSESKTEPKIAEGSTQTLGQY